MAMAIILKLGVLITATLLAGCQVSSHVIVFNNTASPITVRYMHAQVEIAAQTMQRMTVVLTYEPIAVNFADGEARFDVRLLSGPGRCVIPGLRNSVKLQVDSDRTIHILGKDQEAPVQTGACGQFQPIVAEPLD